MNSILELIEHADLCATPVLIAILYAVGSKMVSNHSGLHQWGIRLAAGSFIAYAIYGGLTLRPATSDHWVFILIHAMVAGGIALGLAWICLAAVHFLYRHVVSYPATKLRQFASTPDQRTPTDANRYEEERRMRDQQEFDRKVRESDQAKIKAEAQRRRTDARASASLSYTMYAPKLGNRFTREMFDKYVTDFMGDQHEPGDVERRGQELVTILEKHVQEIQPPKETKTIDELARWFQDQKQRIELSPIDDKAKRMHLVELNQRYSELTSELLQKMKP